MMGLVHAAVACSSVIPLGVGHDTVAFCDGDEGTDSLVAIVGTSSC
jgi:hypothetical protein